MRKLSPALLARYLANPLAVDAEVRAAVGVPEDRYYTVSVWPPHLAGTVYVTGVNRVVRAKKVSKSDQPN